MGCISWMQVCDQIRAKDVFHANAICLHLLLYTSENQGEVT